MLVYNTIPVGVITGFDFTNVDASEFLLVPTRAEAPQGHEVVGRLQQHLAGHARRPLKALHRSNIKSGEEDITLATFQQEPARIAITYLHPRMRLEMALIRGTESHRAKPGAITKIDPSIYYVSLAIAGDMGSGEKRHGVGRFSVWTPIVLEHPTTFEERVLWPGYTSPQPPPKKGKKS